MSHKMPSTEIDKQLQDTFSVYVVDPMHKDIEGQLANLQKKWLGNQEFEDEDTPYLETFMDARLANVKSKLDKQQNAIGDQFKKLTSFLETISDNTDQIDQVADTTASVYETMQSVQKGLCAINNSLTALDNDVNQKTADLKANVAANTESILEAISTSEKNNHTSMHTAAGELKQVLSQAVDTLSHGAEQEKADLKANAAKETEKVLEAISTFEKNSRISAQTAADELEQALAQAVDALSHGAEQEKADLKANAAKEIKKVLDAISTSEENRKIAAEGLKQALARAIETLSQSAQQESTDLKANVAKETKKVLEAISVSEKNSTAFAQVATDKLEQILSEAVNALSHRLEQDNATRQERIDEMSTQVGTLAEQFGAEQKKLRNILYLSLALNSATLLGLVATLLMLLLGT